MGKKKTYKQVSSTGLVPEGQVSKKYKALLLMFVLLIPLVFAGGYVFGSPQLSSTIESGSLTKVADFIVFVDGITYYGLNGDTGAIDYSGTNATTVVQNVENVVDNNGGTIYIRGFQLPDAVVLSQNVMVIEENNGEITYYNEFTNVGFPEKYFTRNASYQNSLTQRRAQYYNGKTYIAFQGDPPTLDPYVIAFDHETETWSDEYKVGTNPMSSDYHGSPSMIINDDGYIHVYWGSHAGSGAPDLQHAKSTNPEDITAWTSMPALTISSTYPQLVKTSNGDIYMFYRYYSGGTHYEAYIVSTDGGDTFGSINTIIDPGAGGVIYHGNTAYDSTNGRIHVTWTIYAASPQRQYVYHAYLNIADGNMYNMTGNSQGTTISLSEMNANCVVFDGGGVDTVGTAADVKLFSNGNPMIAFHNPRTTIPGRRMKFTKWTGSAWSSPVIVFPDDIHLGGANDVLWVVDDNNLQIFAGFNYGWVNTSISGYRNHEKVLKLTSSDAGATWVEEKSIIDGEDIYPEARIFTMFTVLDGIDELKIIITGLYFGDDGLADEFDTEFKLYAWGENGFVYRRFKW